MNNLGADYKRIFILVLKKWYWVVLSLLLALSTAYIINRYTPKIYPVSMTLLIQDNAKQDNSVAEFLYNTQGIGSNTNYQNEEIKLTSFSLAHATVKELNFNVSYYLEGEIKTSEIYPQPPFLFFIDTLSLNISNGLFGFEPVNNTTFLFGKISNNNGAKSTEYEFGKWIQIDGMKFKVENTKRDHNNYKEFLVAFNDLTKLAYDYKQRIKVTGIKKGASILQLSLNGPNPEKDIEYLNALIKMYKQQDIIRKSGNAEKTLNFIDIQLNEISDSLAVLEFELQRFKQKNFITGVSSEAERFYGRLDEFKEKQSELKLQKSYFTYLSQYIENKKAYDDLVVPASIGINHPVLNSFVEQLINLQQEKQNLKSTSSESSPYVKQFDKKISEAEAGLFLTLESLKNSLNIAQNDINGRINGLQQRIDLLPGAEREYINLNRLYKLSEELYTILLEKRAEASISKASTTSDIVLIDPPILTSGPIEPKVQNNVFWALMLGLGFPMVVIFVSDYFNNKVKFKEDIEKYTNTPFLGIVGHNKKEANLIVSNSSNSAVTESFRSIRSNINFFLSKKSEKVILITSSLSGEGKTFCANNLALVFALSGKRTVLIGGDMRRPRLFKDFNISNERGLSNYLSGDFTLNEVIQSTDYSDLSIINSGPIPPNPSELLLRDSMKDLLEDLKKEFHYILIDSPPVGLVTDATLLSQIADHTIYVVRQGYTPLPSLINVQENTESKKLRNVSILFNDVSVSKYGNGYSYKYGYYGYGYSSGKGYYS